MQEYPSHWMTLIPDDIARLAHEQQLGIPQASLSVTKLSKGWRWMRFLPLVAMVLALLFFIVFFHSLNSSHNDTTFPAILFFMAFICIFLIVSMILYNITNKACTLYPCDKGLILRLSLSRFRVIRWDEVETIWQTTIRVFATLYTRNRLYILHCRDGYGLTFRTAIRWKILHARNAKGIEEVIEEQFTRRRMLFQFADYQDRQTLSFGPLSVNCDGIRLQDRLLLWEQVADLSLVNNRLLISHTGEKPGFWASLPTLSIPNSSILLALVKQLRGGQSQPQEEMQFEAPATIVTAMRRIDPLPAELALLAEEHQLGERRVDQLLGRKRISGWPGLMILPVFYVVSVGLGFWLFQFDLASPYTDGWTRISSFLAFSITVGLGGLFFLTICVQGVQQLPRATYTFERGLITHYEKQAPAVYRWDEITRVEHISLFGSALASWGISHGYRFQKRDGSTLTVNAAHINLSRLAALIREQIVPLQLPGMITALQAEQTLHFGQLQVNRQGITLGKRQRPWSQIKSVRQEMHRLAIYDLARRKPWARLPITRVPNLFLLFALADSMRDISSEEAIPHANQNLDVPHLAEIQPLPLKNPSGRARSLSNDAPSRRRVLSVAQILYLIVAGSLILVGVHNLSLPANLTMSAFDVQATQTAQTSMAQATRTVNAGNATAVALETVVSSMNPQAIYQKYTQGKPLFRDSLTSLNTTYFYDPDTMKPDPGCVFQKDGLHITSSNVGYWIPCNNSAFPDLMNFSFQYNFTILKGDSAGLSFRALDTKSYYFSIDTAGNYEFIYYPDVMNGNTSQTLQSGTIKMMHKGYGVQNQLVLIAIGSLFYIYLNQQFVMKAMDQNLTIGELSLLVSSETAPTEAVFSQSVAWNIAGMAP